MKRKLLGILMSLFGLVCLGVAVYAFMDGVENLLWERVLLGSGVVGTISFFAGFALVPLKKSV